MVLSLVRGMVRRVVVAREGGKLLRVAAGRGRDGFVGGIAAGLKTFF